ncbi:cation:proton antiporter [Anaeromyxobacter diazotrophicus]|uniref:Sodium/hydrogen exchanger n=1 Tax=Anaeromyxobacter diazotrophicus TaxID=2590199 RepID=A0A7I9VQP5_9BACT|nr:cation:proton antiporter [Anaeromyxobacter diazotrophicus]GEJ58409.1 sodium/hydrogen exchanger [Anaeromyxobacter diazotrophicus]
MHDGGILLTFAGGLAGALVLGYLAHRLKLSPIVGYLLAGVLVGPFTPGFVANRAVAEQFAEIGVILLLFGVGLRFHLRELVAVWRVALPGAVVQCTASTFLLAVLVRPLGWSWTSGLILGMGVSVASTVVMALVLADRHDLHATIGHIAIGWTVVEDLLTVALLLLLPILFGPGGAEHDPGPALALAGLKVLALVAVVVVLGKWVIPWALERIAKTHVRELFTLGVLVLAVGIAVGSAELFGVSIALGAFLAGLAVGRSEFAARAAGDAVPMRDAFAVLFFVSVGMLFDPRSLVQAPLLTAAVLAVVVVGKPLIAVGTVRLLGVPLATAVPVGAAFSQVGEFSFILGTVARQLGLLDDAGWNALVATSLVSISLNPALYRWARGLTPSAPALAPVSTGERRPLEPNRSILVGYGPVGRVVHRLLVDRGAAVTVVELNLDVVRALKADGVNALYGDVLRPGTLEEAGIATAGNLVLSADVEDAAEIIRQARALNPELRVFARCTHLRDAPGLKRAGANVVAAGEAEIGVALVEAMTAGELADGAALADQRDAVRARLYGPGAPERPARGRV